jgi:hypothetical protein
MSNFVSGPEQDSFARVPLDDATNRLLELHRQVLGQNSRIEVGDGDGAVCVLIAKSELDALERALEILSATEDMRVMRDHLSQLANLCS